MELLLKDTDGTVCPFCAQTNEAGSTFCTHCGRPFPGEKKKSSGRRYLLFGGGVLMLALAVGFFITGFSESAWVGKVNEEGIAREEFSKRVERMKQIYESHYGENLFQGDAGKNNLDRLKAQILDEMITERLLLQEAKNAGYTSAPPEEIQRELEQIKKKNGFSDADIEKMTGMKIEDFTAGIGKKWVISQFIEKVVLKGQLQNADAAFKQWFAKAKGDAKIEVYEKLAPVATSSPACCSSGSGGCGGGGRAQPLDPKIEQEARTKGLEYYENKTKKNGATARVTNFGCHIQVDIMEGDKVIASLTYRQGEVEEI